FVVKSGSAADPSGKNGLAYLTAALLKKGTEYKTAAQISEEIEFVGGEINTSVDHDVTYISGEFLSRDFVKGIELLHDILVKPTFSEDEFEREKRHLISRVATLKDEPSYLANVYFQQYLFGPEHPYGGAVMGKISTIESITREDVLNFYEKHYMPNNIIAIIVGDLKVDEVITRLEEMFGDWKPGLLPQAEIPDITPVTGRRYIIVNRPELTQAQIRIGNVGIERNHEEYFPVIVTNNILGGGFTSRLVNEIRVNRGLSYGVYSNFATYKWSGYFIISTFTKNETTLETINVALEQLDKIKKGGVSGDELKSSENYLAGLFPLRLETPEDLARQIFNIEFYGLQKDYVKNYRKNVYNVSMGDVNRILESLFPYSNLLIVVLGDASKIREQLLPLGKFEIVSVD
ncbi:MAG: M16 family metallopeptidase, partial [Fidelibacterota bacterium]